MKSPSITADLKTVQNSGKLIDLLMGIQLTRAIVMPRLSDFLTNSTIRFRMFLCFITCFLTGTFGCYAGRNLYKRCMFQFISIYLVKRDKKFRACDRHSNENATVSKYVTKYISMRKWTAEFFRKCDSRGITIARVNSIRITKSINLL